MSIRRAKPKKNNHANIEHTLVAFIGLLLALVISFVASVGYERFDNQTLQVWFFDVGQGDATFVITPNGKQVLIDAGPSSSVLSKLGSVMPFWDRSLDAIVMTHPDSDHISGFVQVLERYKVDMIIESGTDSTTDIAAAVDRAVALEQADHVFVESKDVFVIDGVLFEVLWPENIENGEIAEDSNNSSVVLRITYDQTNILLTGDAEEEVELEILDQLGEIDVLKVGHHGSISSTSTEFLSVIEPEYVLISCGLENRYGHPHPIVLDRLGQIGSKIFRTDLDGDILLSSDGGEPQIRSAPLMF